MKHNETAVTVILILFFFLISCSERSGEPKAIITVPQGTIKVGFFQKEAPLHVSNFISLAEDGFYNKTTFHRIIRGFVLQGGDPKSKNNYTLDDGTGQVGHTVPSEYHLKHFRGALAMAKLPAKFNAENASSGCQFYIALDSLPVLDRNTHTVFGYVETGFDVLKTLEMLRTYDNDNPNNSSERKTEMKIEIIYEKTKKPSDN